MKSTLTIHSGTGISRSWDASVELPVDMAKRLWSPGTLLPGLIVKGEAGKWMWSIDLKSSCDIGLYGIEGVAGMTEGEIFTVREERPGWEEMSKEEGNTFQLCQGRVTVLGFGGRKGEGRYGATGALERDPGMTLVLDTKERSEEKICPGDTDGIPGKPYW